ncbi:MAG: CBS domain-containing protein [Anaerolineae bacterium]|nr:CBS domain-containing protein [Anaerolineae bacterium]
MYTVKLGTTLVEAVRIMGSRMVGTIPVIDDESHVVGVLVLDDLLTQFMPKFVQVLRTTDFVHDYSKFEMGPRAAEMLEKPLDQIMRPPYFLSESSSLMEAMVFMHNHQVVDVPVVNAEKQLVGLVSRVRVGSLFLTAWLDQKSE